MSEFSRTNEVLNEHVGQILLEGHCWGFVRSLHILQYPSVYDVNSVGTDTVRIEGKFGVYDYPYEEMIAACDSVLLDPETELMQKAVTIADTINTSFDFMRQTYGLTTPGAWREYILTLAIVDNDDPYKDNQGNILNVADILPDASTWDQLFTPAYHLSPAKLARWLSQVGPTEVPDAT